VLPVAQFVATLCCIVFAGAAIYVCLVEHPARMSCSTQNAATVWAPSYKRGTWMQAPLAIVSFLAGTASWLLGAGIGWLVAAISSPSCHSPSLRSSPRPISSWRLGATLIHLRPERC
jgi:hypothetical protein